MLGRRHPGRRVAAPDWLGSVGRKGGSWLRRGQTVAACGWTKGLRKPFSGWLIW